MAVKILYIDDEKEIPHGDVQDIQSRLEIPGEFECELSLPPVRLSDLPTMPDALLVDMDLSTAEINGEKIDYLGSTLASEIRMRYSDRPIALITKTQVITALASQIQILEDSVDVDLILEKDDVIEAPEVARRKITALIDGFQKLAKVSKSDWEPVVKLMGADEEEAKLLREASAPIKKGMWTTPVVSRWIRNVVMGYPGILYDELTAATRLGVNLESFQNEKVKVLFQPAEYAGIFAAYKKRWWRDRLFREAQRLILKHNLSGPIPEKFIEAFTLEFGEQLQPAVCIVDGTPVADWVCYILYEPVKLENSIPYYPDSRPDVMDQARVSLKAIDESDKFDENLVDADSFELVVKPRWGLE